MYGVIALMAFFVAAGSSSFLAIGIAATVGVLATLREFRSMREMGFFCSYEDLDK